MKNVSFADELARVLPSDLPNRDRFIEKSARHLEMVKTVNEYMNLTRIVDPKEAAIKHTLDSVLPWRHFQHAARVIDAGTGAGFPGIPLAIALPHVRFTLAESIQKKARFVETVVEELDLHNARVIAGRAELIASTPEIVTARAVAPLDRLLENFSKFLRDGAQLLLYKGPDAASELAGIADARTKAHILDRFELPENCGVRTIVSVSRGRAARDKQAAASPR